MQPIQLSITANNKNKI